MDSHGKGFVLQPEEGESFWQPVPANGYVVNKLFPENWDGPFSLGLQVVGPNSYIRRHIHDRHREVLFVWGGTGRAVVDGEDHRMQPGTVIALPAGVEHMFVNEGEEELRLLWILAPHGLEAFFRQIGRPRQAGEPAPSPFPRPANVLEIEAATVFKPGSTSV
ncbi:MAG TPA: cupin domain-containing protein [Acetobacteraceae bacterium]|nr:cupin domain-containing protein [Acetobacteraceae bacterium]